MIISVLKLMDELINAGHAGLGILMFFVIWSLITFSKYARPVSEFFFLLLNECTIYLYSLLCEWAYVCFFLLTLRISYLWQDLSY